MGDQAHLKYVVCYGNKSWLRSFHNPVALFDMKLGIEVTGEAS